MLTPDIDGPTERQIKLTERSDASSCPDGNLLLTLIENRTLVDTIVSTVKLLAKIIDVVRSHNY